MKNKKPIMLIIFYTVLGIGWLLFPSLVKADNGKRPTWVIAEISLPVPEKVTNLSCQLVKSKENEEIIIFSYRLSEKREVRALNIRYNVELDKKLARQIYNSQNLAGIGWESINNYILFPYRAKLNGTPFSVESESKYLVNCDSPMNSWLNFYKDDQNIASYSVIFSSPKKFYLQTRGICWGMDGKDHVWVNNISNSISIWPLMNNQILLGDYDKPYFVIIDLTKIDQMLKETKVKIFDKKGVKIFWVKRSLVENWVDSNANTNVKRIGKSLNEYIDKKISENLIE